MKEKLNNLLNYAKEKWTIAFIMFILALLPTIFSASVSTISLVIYWIICLYIYVSLLCESYEKLNKYMAISILPLFSITIDNVIFSVITFIFILIALGQPIVFFLKDDFHKAEHKISLSDLMREFVKYIIVTLVLGFIFLLLRVTEPFILALILIFSIANLINSYKTSDKLIISEFCGVVLCICLALRNIIFMHTIPILSLIITGIILFSIYNRFKDEIKEMIDDDREEA